MKKTLRLAVVLLFLFTGAGIADTTETRYFSASLRTANEVGQTINFPATGEAFVTLHLRRDNAGNLVAAVAHFDVDYNFGQPAVVRGLHIHEGAAGVNGPIRIDSGIDAVNTVSASGQGNIFRSVEPTSATAFAAINGILSNPAGYYVNLHTNDYTGGLMRGQLQAASQPTPTLYSGGVVNNASYAPSPAPVAPGSIAAIFGKYLNDGSIVTSSVFGPDGKLVTVLGGTQVKVNGIPAPIFYSTIGQVGIQIPVELSGLASARVELSVGNKTSLAETVALDAAVPGIFTQNRQGTGPAAALHQDGITPITPENPAQPNEIVILFGTGCGAADPPLATGEASSGNRCATMPTIAVDGVPATVEFAGRAPNFVGLDQFNVRLSPNVRRAPDLPLRIIMGARQSNTASLATASTSEPPPPENPPEPPPPYDYGYEY